MSTYDKITKEIESLHKNLFVDDIGEKDIQLVLYSNETDDLLDEIYDILSEYDKNNFLFDISIRKDEKQEQYMLLSYGVDIGEDLPIEKSEFEKVHDQKKEDIQDDNAMRMRGF